MESAGSWNGPEPIRGFPRPLCRLPILSTRHRDRSQETSPVLVDWGIIYNRHSCRRGSPGPCRACVPKPRSCPNERESSGVGVETDQYRNVGFSYFPSLERARLVQIGNGDRIRCLGFHTLSPFSAATKTLDKVKLNAR